MTDYVSHTTCHTLRVFETMNSTQAGNLRSEPSSPEFAGQAGCNMTDKTSEVQSECFSFHTRPDTVCVNGPPTFPSFTALQPKPSASSFSFAPFTAPSAMPLVFKHWEAASTLSRTPVCCPATHTDLTCYESLVSKSAVSMQLHEATC